VVDTLLSGAALPAYRWFSIPGDASLEGSYVFGDAGAVMWEEGIGGDGVDGDGGNGGGTAAGHGAADDTADAATPVSPAVVRAWWAAAAPAVAAACRAVGGSR